MLSEFDKQPHGHLNDLWITFCDKFKPGPFSKSQVIYDG